MENSPESVFENHPNRDDVMELVRRHEKRTGHKIKKVTKEEFDQFGPTFMEMRVEGGNSERYIEIVFMRKGEFNTHEATETNLFIYYYENGQPTHDSTTLARLDYAKRQWDYPL